VWPGKNVGQGKDHTLFAAARGKVNFTKSRKKDYTGKTKRVSVVNII